MPAARGSVNIDGTDPSLAQLQRCFDDGMLYKCPRRWFARVIGGGCTHWVVAEVTRLRGEWDTRVAATKDDFSSGVGDESREVIKL